MKNNIIWIVFFIVKLIMNPLTNDEWSYIMSFIENNNDKCNLLRTCKQIGNCDFYFYGRICLKKVNGSTWYDKFINVIVDDFVTLSPRGLTPTSLAEGLPLGGLTPTSLARLTFGNYFNQPIKDYISFGVTHLTFGLTHLTFGFLFNQPINECIPLGVTHLTFGYYFNQPINDCIPLGVTHLTFGSCFNKPIKDCIPSSVKYLEFKGNYGHPIENFIKRNINIIVNGKSMI